MFYFLWGTLVPNEDYGQWEGQKIHMSVPRPWRLLLYVISTLILATSGLLWWIINVAQYADVHWWIDGSIFFININCLNHELLIAKLEAYGFDIPSLRCIYSYLSNRKQRTKVNNSFSEWCNILFGVPKGSILGPLLFNIFINDIFFFLSESDIASYADDTTPYSIDSNIDSLMYVLEVDTNILIKWFENNYLKLNTDKCHLLVSNYK